MHYCDICEKTFKDNRTLKCHLESALHKLRAENRDTLRACICGKTFKYKQGLYRHRKTCEIHKEHQTKATTTKEVEQLRLENRELQKQLEMLKMNQAQPSVVSTNTNIETQNIETQKIENTNIENQTIENNMTQNVTIQINAVGEENLDHITDQIIIKCIGQIYKSIPCLLEHVHYDPKHPENLNTKIPNKKQPYATVFKRKENKWRTIDREEAIDDMMDRGYNILDDNYPHVEDKLSARSKHYFKRFQENFEKDPETRKNVRKKVDMMVMDATRNLNG
jgi:hypothetical protein